MTLTVPSGPVERIYGTKAHQPRIHGMDIYHPGLPTPEVETSGPFQIGAWSIGRVARLGRGAYAGRKFISISPTKELLPEGFEVYAALHHGNPKGDDYFDIVHAQEDGMHISIYSYGPTYKEVAVYSDDPGDIGIANRLLKEIFVSAKPVPVPPDDSINTDFWRLTPNGPASTSRSLLVPEWETICHNYTPPTQKKLAELQAMKGIEDSQSGNLIVLHGPAGTGKTTALRSLARSWKGWADTHYIIDPDNFLNFPDYLWQAVLTVSDIKDKRWKLLIMEDVDELIREGAKKQVGQSFSRLLNLADGFLGQGQRLIIVLTTNEPVEKLSAAITRPGRCLAHIEVPKFTSSEATAWMGSPVSEHKTLAELYELQAKEHQIVSKSNVEVPGQYL